MRKPLVFGSGILALVLTGMQLVPVKRSNPPVTGEIQVPGPVRAILARSCYDCHSNTTRWPWYARVAPASWILADHVKEGRENLNFSAWTWLPPAEQREAGRKVAEELSEGKMPLTSYLLLHRNARLSDAEVGLMRAYFTGADVVQRAGADSGAAGAFPPAGFEEYDER